MNTDARSYSNYLLWADPYGDDYYLAATRTDHALFAEGGTDAFSLLYNSLGTVVAEPEWHTRQKEGEAGPAEESQRYIGYLLHVDADAVESRPTCEPVAAKDIKKGWYKKEIKRLLDELDGAGDSADRTARDIREAARTRLEEFQTPAQARDVGNYLFKYKGVDGKLRLVWCWAHQRKDKLHAEPVLCPRCRRLFVYRDQDRKNGVVATCPWCRWQRGGNVKKLLLYAAMFLLFAMLLGGAGYWYINRPAGEPELIVRPDTWTGPVEATIPLSIKHRDAKGTETDVTDRSTLHSDQTDVLRVTDGETSLVAVGVGSATVRVEYGGLSQTVVYSVLDVPPPSPEAPLVIQPDEWRGPGGATVPIAVIYRDSEGNEKDVTLDSIITFTPRGVARLADDGASIVADAEGGARIDVAYRNANAQATFHVDSSIAPKEVRLEPDALNLGVGAAERLKLIGVFEDGREVDLSADAEWKTSDEGVLFLYRGLAEGLSKGTADVESRYRPNDQVDYLTADTTVTVVPASYDHLEVVLDRETLNIGQATRLRVDAITESGERQSVSESSRLVVRVEPDNVAQLDGSILRATSVGDATITAELDDISVETGIHVVRDENEPVFVVRPQSVSMAIGEVVDLEVDSSGEAPIELTSSDTSIVEIEEAGRLVGRSTGTAEVTVTQGENSQVVEVDVAQVPIERIVIRPDTVTVTVDGEVKLSVVGYRGEGESGLVELSPDQVTWPQVPPPTYAVFDTDSLCLTGRASTDSAVQQITARLGELEATAPVNVISQPVKLELVPTGPVTLPVGQRVAFDLWADYSGGRRVLVEPDRVEWKLQPEQQEDPNLEFADGVVSAVKEGGAPLSVVASFQGADSNEVVVKAAPAVPVDLALQADPQLMVVGSTGQLSLTAAADGQPVDLVPGDVAFSSSDPAKLEVDESTGGYRAIAPGEVTVTVTHPAATAPATLAANVTAEGQASLVFRPDDLQLTVGTQRELDLVLIGSDGREQSLLAGSSASDVVVTAPNPEVVEWSPPFLIAKAAAEPFELAAAYQGQTATARVEILEMPEETDAAVELRVNPESVTLAPLQSLTPRLEQRRTESEEWCEIPAEAVQWTVPEEVHWNEPLPNLRPLLTVPELGTGPYQLTAEHNGRTATLVVTVEGAGEPFSVDDPDVELEVRRDPPGDHLPVGYSQRYWVVLRRGEREQAAEDAVWQEDFESEHVRWRAPVLTAHAPDRTVMLTARVGEREVTFSTRTDPPPPDIFGDRERAEPGASSMTPTSLVIETDLSDGISLPVGVLFDSFRVVAREENGPPQNVTGSARLTLVSDTEPTPAQIEDGGILTVSAGTVSIGAEFGGLTTENRLDLVISDELTADRIEVQPAQVCLSVGESIQFKAYAFAGDAPLGQLIGHPELVWKSRSPETVEIQGPVATAIAGGDGAVTAQIDTLVSNVAEVRVAAVGAIQPETLAVRPARLRIEAGQSARIGSDVRVYLGPKDVTDQCDVLATRREIVTYDPSRSSLVAAVPGRADVAFVRGDQQVTLPVIVAASSAVSADAVPIIDPAHAVLAVGQSRALRVYVENERGRRADHTATAMLRSSDDSILQVVNGAIVAQSVGSARVAAVLPDLKPGYADFTVVNADIQDIAVSPGRLELYAGQSQRLVVTGVAAGARRPLNDHSDLQLRIEGPDADAIQLSQSTVVTGIQPGNASVSVIWRGNQVRRVPVAVADGEITGIEIRPGNANLTLGDSINYEVFARQRGRRYGIGPRDGVELTISDNSVAGHGEGLEIVGLSPGTTQVTARLGPHQATAGVFVRARSPRDQAPAPPVTPVSLHFERTVLRLPAGGPETGVRVFELCSNGSQADVTGEVTLETEDDKGVISLSPLQPALSPLTPGFVFVHATRGEMKTGKPLMVEVSAVDPDRLRLAVSPSPLVVRQGDTMTFRRVVVASEGVSPIPVDYRVRSLDEGLARIVDDAGVQGVTSGRARVVVTAVAPDTGYDGLETTALVDVYAGTPGDDQPEGEAVPLRLVLNAPTQMTIGSRAPYSVNLVQGSRAWPVTDDETVLVIANPDEENPLAEINARMEIVARQTGVVTLHARHRSHISNAVRLHIDPPPTDFDSVSVVMDRTPMHVGEVREYRVMAAPTGGGGDRDLTAQVADSSTPGQPVVRVEGAAVEHATPNVVAREAGTAQLIANLGDLESVPLTITVAAEEPPVAQLRITPSQTAMLVGQVTRTFEVEARRTGDGDFVPVAADVRSLDTQVLESDPTTPNRFRAIAQGTTQLEAEFGGKKAFAQVRVLGNRFLNVKRSEDLRIGADQNTFSVDVKVVGGTAEGPMEYRIVPAEEGFVPPEGGWKEAAQVGDQLEVELESPVFSGIRETYQATIESRDRKTQTVQRYPFSFRLSTRDSAK